MRKSLEGLHREACIFLVLYLQFGTSLIGDGQKQAERLEKQSVDSRLESSIASSGLNGNQN